MHQTVPGYIYIYTYVYIFFSLTNYNLQLHFLNTLNFSINPKIRTKRNLVIIHKISFKYLGRPWQ